VKRFLATLTALAAFSLVLSACNVVSSSSSAATVQSGGTTVSITTGELNSTLAALAADRGYLCVGGLTATQTAGAGVGTYAVSYADTVLTQLVKFAVTRDLVTSLHLVIPAGASAMATAQVQARITSELASAVSASRPCTGTAQTIMSGLGTYYRQALENNQLEQDALDSYLAGVSLQPAALAGYEQAHVAATLESCTSLIDVATRKLAQQLYGQIHGGASFATVADAHASQGTGPGGAVGCPLESEWVGGLGATVAKLTVGQLSSPVAFNGGWLLLLVSSRKLEPFPNLLAQLATTEATAFQKLTGRAYQRSKVSVASVYGSWTQTSSSSGIEVGISPPPDKASKFAPTTTAAAAQPAA